LFIKKDNEDPKNSESDISVTNKKPTKKQKSAKTTDANPSKKRKTAEPAENLIPSQESFCPQNQELSPIRQENTSSDKCSEWEKKLKAKREKLTIAIPEENMNKTPYQIPTTGNNNKISSALIMNLSMDSADQPQMSAFNGPSSRYLDKGIFSK